MIDHIRSVAESVRYWAEGRAVGTEGEDDLTGWCAIASAHLWRELLKIGVVGELHAWVSPADNSSAHVFLVVDDHIVDVTATQFGRMRAKPVHIQHLREAQIWDWYNSQQVFQTPEQLIKWQKRERWNREQIAWSK